jgi:hypothetical protein
MFAIETPGDLLLIGSVVLIFATPAIFVLAFLATELSRFATRRGFSTCVGLAQASALRAAPASRPLHRRLPAKPKGRVQMALVARRP